MRRPSLKFPDLKRRAPAAALTAFYLYLGYHAFSGSQGLVKWMEQSDRADYLQTKLERLEAHREALQGDVDRLSSRTLDLDALDIAARETLFVAKEGEVTIWLDP